MPFKLTSQFKPAGDQPAAIAELTKRINRGDSDVVLLGATGTGKTYYALYVIEKISKNIKLLENGTTPIYVITNTYSRHDWEDRTFIADEHINTSWNKEVTEKIVKEVDTVKRGIVVFDDILSVFNLLLIYF